MKNYIPRLAAYLATSLIGVSILCNGCHKRENASSKPSQIEIKASEESQLKFEKSLISDKINVQYSGVGASPIAVTCGDIDGDGTLDIIVASRDGLTIYLNKNPSKK